MAIHGNLPAFTETMGKKWKQLVAALGLELIEVERRAGGKDRTVARHFLKIFWISTQSREVAPSLFCLASNVSRSMINPRAESLSTSEM